MEGSETLIDVHAKRPRADIVSAVARELNWVRDRLVS
jgi:hypothetical protein